MKVDYLLLWARKISKIENYIPIAVFLCFLLFSCHSCQLWETDRWKAPRFVKEWEIKEIIPGLATQIVSMTANKNGVFALVKSLETKYLPPPIITKKASEMTEKEKEDFFYQYQFFSGSVMQKMSKQEKDELINFLIKYFMLPRKVNEITEREREEIINFVIRHKETKDTEINIRLFREGLQKEGRDKYIERFYENIQKAVREDVEHFSVQQYDFEGNFINQWPEANKLSLPNQLRAGLKPVFIYRSNVSGDKSEIDIRDHLIRPIFIDSDKSGNLYLADYKGNKILKFDKNGNVINLWWIEEPKKKEGYFEDLGSHCGFFLSEDRLYLIAKGYDRQIGSGPLISEFDLSGRLIRRKTIKPPKVPEREGFEGKSIPNKKEDGQVGGIIADNEGNLYLFSPDSTVLMLDHEWNEKGYIETILKEGFEKPKPVYSSDYKREVTYRDWLPKDESFRSFSSDKFSWIEGQPWLYFANGIYWSPDETIYVTFIGMKPFGVIDAMIFNKKGKMVAYWKRDQKSYSPWFEKLTDYQKLVTTEIWTEMAFYDNHIFIGRSFWAGTPGKEGHTVIQMFAR